MTVTGAFLPSKRCARLPVMTRHIWLHWRAGDADRLWKDESIGWFSQVSISALTLQLCNKMGIQPVKRAPIISPKATLWRPPNVQKFQKECWQTKTESCSHRKKHFTYRTLTITAIRHTITLATIDMGQSGGRGWCAPYPVGGAGSPSNTMLPGPRPTSIPSGILIHSTVWPQYTNITNRRDRQWSHGIGETVTCNGRPKTYHNVNLSERQ